MSGRRARPEMTATRPSEVVFFANGLLRILTDAANATRGEEDQGRMETAQRGPAADTSELSGRFIAMIDMASMSAARSQIVSE